MTKERAGSLILLIAGIYGLVLSLQMPMGRWNEPGAGMFPLIVSILLCLSGIMMFFSGKEKIVSDLRTVLNEQQTPFRIVLFTAAFIAVLDWLGYLLTSSLYIFALLFWVSHYRIWIAIGAALAIGTVSWYLFAILLETPLPQGFLKF